MFSHFFNLWWYIVNSDSMACIRVESNGRNIADWLEAFDLSGHKHPKYEIIRKTPLHPTDKETYDILLVKSSLISKKSFNMKYIWDKLESKKPYYKGRLLTKLNIEAGFLLREKLSDSDMKKFGCQTIVVVTNEFLMIGNNICFPWALELRTGETFESDLHGNIGFRRADIGITYDPKKDKEVYFAFRLAPNK